MNAAMIEPSHILMPEYRPDLRDLDEIIELVEQIGLSYIHSSGCAVLNDGTWLQPDEWQIWIDYMAEENNGRH